MAAQNGHGKAQFQIGEFYLNGKCGYSQDLEAAKLWYRRAAANGNKNAREKLKSLGEE